jgi:hypothetical protein
MIEATSGPFEMLDETGKEAARFEARAAVTAYLDALQDTHALVPRDPTSQMIVAGVAERHGQPVPEAWSLATANIYRAMIDAAPPAEAGDGWMPIETLPAEGLYLLASNAGPEHSVHHAGHFFEVWSARSYHAAINPNSTPAQRTLLREAQLVTHWRPLPAPPAAQDPRP